MLLLQFIFCVVFFPTFTFSCNCFTNQRLCQINQINQINPAIQTGVQFRLPDYLIPNVRPVPNVGHYVLIPSYIKEKVMSHDDVIIPIDNSSDVIHLDKDTYGRMQSLINKTLRDINRMQLELGEPVDISPVLVKNTLDGLLAGKNIKTAFEGIFKYLRSSDMSIDSLTAEDRIVNSFVKNVDYFERSGRPTNALVMYLNLLKVGKTLEHISDVELINLDPSEIFEHENEEEEEVLTVDESIAMAIAILNLALTPLLLLSPESVRHFDERTLESPIVHLESKLKWRPDLSIRSPSIVDFMQRITDSLLFNTRLPLRGEPELLQVMEGLRGVDPVRTALLIIRIPVSGTLDEIDEMLMETFPTRLLITGYRILYASTGMVTGRES